MDRLDTGVFAVYLVLDFRLEIGLSFLSHPIQKFL